MPSPSDLKPGVLLISEPFLEDPSFKRSVILLCEHSSSHSFGLVLTQPQEVILDSIMDAKVMGEIPLFAGGPVDPTILQFIHRRPDLIQGGQEILSRQLKLSWMAQFHSKRLNFLLDIRAGRRANSIAN
jgi:putative transcriptional regulator